MKTLLVLLLVFCGVGRAAPPPPFVLAEADDEAPITVYSDYLRDPGGELSLDDVRQPDAAEGFRPAAHTLQRLGFSDEPWWLRVGLRNETGQLQHKSLVITTGPVSGLTLYGPSPDGYQIRAPEPVEYDHFLPQNKHLFTLALPPDATRTYYLRVQPDHGFRYSLHLKSLSSELEDAVVQAGWFWLACGLVLGLVLYHLILFALNRQPAYLAYSLFFALVTLVVVSHSGLSKMGAQPRLDAFVIFLGLSANVWLAHQYLRIRSALPRAHRPMVATMLTLALAALVTGLLPPMLALDLSYSVAALVALGLFWLGIYAWQRDTDQAALFVLARTAITLITLLVVASLQGWYTLQMNSPALLIAAGAFEAVLLALGLHRSRETGLRQSLQARQQKHLDEALHEVRRDTLARVSHEVRTPMSGIMGMAEILEETPLTPNQREYVHAIQSAGDDLLRVVSNVLVFSGEATEAAESGRDSFALTPCVMEAMELFRERAEEKDIELIPHIHANVPVRVHGNAGQLRQILVNLLACAARHGHPGELVIDVARDPTGRGGHLRFEMSGSALRDTDTIWSGLEEDQRQPGTGDSTALGLSIARQLVESMDGQLQLHQDRQRRPLCRFSLPLPDADGDPADPRDVSLSGYNLLVVDDSPTVTRVIRQQALSWGMRVTVTHDPREALATIRTHAHIRDAFDVLLVDHQMPGMDGLQLAERVREDPSGESLAIIMLSGVQMAPSNQAAREAGLHEVLTKPVSGARLRHSLAAALGLVSHEPAPETQPEAQPPALRLLVAEDDPLSRQVIEGMLNKLGMHADLVSNGREALEAFQAREYDFILMDCEMPEMDGFEAARQIRALEAEQERTPVPIIALTAHILREHRERSEAADMNAHIPKPVELAVLREVISRFADPGARRPGRPPASDERPG